MRDYDIFYTPPDTVETMYCKVCGTQCKAERSLTNPTGFAEAMAHRGHWHDEFTCPYRNQRWHEQALELVLEMERTPSNRLAHLIRLDLQDILDKHLP